MGPVLLKPVQLTRRGAVASRARRGAGCLPQKCPSRAPVQPDRDRDQISRPSVRSSGGIWEYGWRVCVSSAVPYAVKHRCLRNARSHLSSPRVKCMPPNVQADAITGFMHKSGENRQAKFAAAKIRGSYATASQVRRLRRSLWDRAFPDGTLIALMRVDGAAGGCRNHRLQVKDWIASVPLLRGGGSNLICCEVFIFMGRRVPVCEGVKRGLGAFLAHHARASATPAYNTSEPF